MKSEVRIPVTIILKGNALADRCQTAAPLLAAKWAYSTLTKDEVYALISEMSNAIRTFVMEGTTHE